MGANSLSNLGNAHARLGERKAREHERALAIHRHPETGNDGAHLRNLGAIWKLETTRGRSSF
jgi:hypothetical protein